MVLGEAEEELVIVMSVEQDGKSKFLKIPENSKRATFDIIDRPRLGNRSCRIEYH
jgi:hypothetical protein